MIISTLVNHVGDALLSAVRSVAEEAPAESPGGINTDGIVGFITTKIAPILIAAIGVIFLSRAHKGEMSKVLTSSAIVIIGIAFIVGAGALFLFGESLIDLVFE